MPSKQVQARSRTQKSSRPQARSKRDGRLSKKDMDAATLASKLQLQDQRREVIYSLMALAMKLGLLAISAASLVKLGLAAHQRVVRHSELSAVLDVETVKFIGLQKRFDRLFTIGGDRLLIDAQDQWIAPNRVRVIWR